MKLLPKKYLSHNWRILVTLQQCATYLSL